MRWCVLLMIGCGASRSTVGPAGPTVPESAPGEFADVVSVSISGGPGAYSFAVALQSPDTGCEQYADWWEVVDASGDLVYRRILGHSHANEQPFTRSGGPIDVQADTPLWIRAHMNPGAYGGVVFVGSIADGFVAGEAPSNAEGLASTEPLPTGCAF